jgi:phosphomevalonate kinase
MNIIIPFLPSQTRLNTLDWRTRAMMTKHIIAKVLQQAIIKFARAIRPKIRRVRSNIIVRIIPSIRRRMTQAIKAPHRTLFVRIPAIRAGVWDTIIRINEALIHLFIRAISHRKRIIFIAQVRRDSDSAL